MKCGVCLLVLLWVGCGSASAVAVVADSVASRQLDEVVALGELPQVRSAEGAMIVDLPAIVGDKPVSNVLEALGYLPGVVSQNGLIALGGAVSTTILINGEVSQMSVQQLYQLLYSMPVERLKYVEVMYSAPAKYRVSGAVINVCLREPSVWDGLQGQVRGGVSHQHYASLGGVLSAVYAVRKWTFDFNHSITKAKTWQGEDMVSLHALQGNRYRIEESDRAMSESLVNQVNVSAGYTLADNQHIKVSYVGQFKTDVYGINRSEGSFGRYSNESEYLRPGLLHDVTLRYKLPFGLSLMADWLSYGEERRQLVSGGADNSVFSTIINNQQVNRLYLVADMDHSFGGWRLGYGADYKLSCDRGRLHYIEPQLSGFDNELRERSIFAYVSLGYSFAGGLSLTGSMGEEMYDMNGLRNWIFRPRLGLTYAKNPRHIIQASFDTSRNYPLYWMLHGGVTTLNPYSEVRGNPELRPSTTYSANISYVFKQKYVATLFGNNTADYSVQLPYQATDDLKLIFQELNFNYNRMIGVNLSAPFSVTSWMETRLTAQGFINSIRADKFHDIAFQRTRFVGYGQVQNTIKLRRGLSLTLDGRAISKSLQGNAVMSALWRVDAGAKWIFGKRDCCEMNLRADDLFNKWSPTMRIDAAGQDYTMHVRDFSRSFKLTFIWRFNGFKPKDMDIDISRLGTGK